jgi:dihydrofolate reductase
LCMQNRVWSLPNKGSSRIVATTLLSADNRIADADGATSWRSHDDRAFFAEVLAWSDVILVGPKTFELDFEGRTFYGEKKIVVCLNTQEILDALEEEKRAGCSVLIAGGMSLYEVMCAKQLCEEWYITRERGQTLRRGLEFISPSNFDHNYKLEDIFHASANTVIERYKPRT